MHFHFELSPEAKEHLRRFPRKQQERLARVIDQLEENDDSVWTNVKALQGPEWKGRLRKRTGDYRIIFRKFPERGLVEVSAILIKSKHTYE
jgi:mRNA-degrading endonuclease RelE of RelBE toxin-antitoxin system